MGGNGMENIITMINKVQDVFSGSGMVCSINLPQIVVVGCQSAGKSSVLENIVGRDFLPRGSGIVTRRPLVLQLVQAGEEYGEFLHQNKRYYDFAEIKKEIEAETFRTCGNSKMVSGISINLKVYSPQVIDLTLVDLPGLTKVAVGGQSQDVVGMIRNMVLKFIQNPNSLILAVTPATTDLANSDSLQIAKEVDPSGSRTIGVITKLDMMDATTSARDILENKVFPLEKGYIGVINRSQQDIDEQTPIGQALQKETDFFANHPHYRDMSHRLGTAFLQKKLNSQLMDHIVAVLPSLYEKISEQLAQLSPQVAEIEANSGNLSHRKMMDAINNFAELVSNNLMSISSPSLLMDNALSTGAVINQVFFKSLPSMLKGKLEENSDKIYNTIQLSIQNVHGVKSGLYTPDLAFEMIVRMEIQRSIDPIKACLDEVFSYVQASTDQCLATFESLPNLLAFIKRLVLRALRTFYKETYEQLELTINLHMDYINTNHPQFIGTPEFPSRPGEKVENKPIDAAAKKRGFVTVNNLQKSRGSNVLFLALSGDSLQFFKDEDEREKKLQIPVSRVRYATPSSDNAMFKLVSADRANLYKDLREMELMCGGAEECNEWISGLRSVGMSANTGEVPPVPNRNVYNLGRGVSNIKDCFDSYLKVYQTIILDIVPKVIFHCFLKKFVNYSKSELIAELYSHQSLDELCQQSPEEMAHNKQILDLFYATKEAGDYIYQACRNAGYTNLNRSSLAPPVVSSIGRGSPRNNSVFSSVRK